LIFCSDAKAATLQRKDGSVSNLSDLETRILEKVDAHYEKYFLDSVSSQELCSIHSLAAQLLEVAASH
jgi:hypothetical protein